MASHTDSLLAVVTETALAPALALLPPHFDSARARVMLLAIGLQESRFVTRYQYAGGPARGWWQFERGTPASRGGVTGVLLYAPLQDLAASLCARRFVAPRPESVYIRLASDDVLAAGFARLLLYTDRAPLPALGDQAGAWTCYADRTWRPGKPHPETWPANYARALRFVTGAAA